MGGLHAGRQSSGSSGRGETSAGWNEPPRFEGLLCDAVVVSASEHSS